MLVSMIEGGGSAPFYNGPALAWNATHLKLRHIL